MRSLLLPTYALLLFVTACSSDTNTDALASEPVDETAPSVDSEPVVNPESLTNDDTITLDPAYNVHESAFELIRDLAAYKSDQIAGVVPDLAGVIIESAIGAPEVLEGGEFVTSDSRFGDVITETDRRLYQCSNGGTLLHETGTMRLVDISYSHDRGVNSYEFDQCQFAITTDRVAAGSYTAHGGLYTSDHGRSGSRFSEGAGNVEWSTFELAAPNSLRYEIDGSSTWNSLSTTGNSGSSRQSSYTHYRKTQESELINEMTNSSFKMDTNDHPVNLVNTLELQFSGSFEDSRGGGRVITVNTVNPLSFSAGLGEEPFIQQGEISVQSSDGGSMTLIASGSDDRTDPSKNPLVDWTSTSADGRIAIGTGESLGAYSVVSRRCSFSPSDGPLLCSDGGYVYLLP